MTTLNSGTPASSPSSGITLAEADDTLLNSVVHGGGFSKAKRYRAIRASGEHLLRKTGLSRRVDEVTINATDQKIDVATTLSTFLSGHMHGSMWLTDADGRMYPVEMQSFANVRQLYDRSDTSGRPEIFAWITPTTFWCFPRSDATYTLHLPWNEPLTAFDDDEASPEDVELNVPRQYAYDWLWWGGRAYMLLGAQGHPDAGPAMEAFDRFCEEIKGQIQAEGAWLNTPDHSPGSIWGGGGYV